LSVIPAVRRGIIASDHRDFFDAVLADSPTSYWRLADTGANVTDTQNLHNGTESGNNTENVAGLLTRDYDGAVQIGSSGVIDLGHSTDFDPNKSFSIELIFKTAGSLPGAFVSLIDNHDGSTSNNGFLVYITNANKILFQFGNQKAWTGPTISTSTRYHVICTWDNSGNLIMYVNGAPVTTSPSGTGGASATSKNLFVGVAVGGGGEPTGFVIDEVAYYPSVLSANRVGVHYLAGIGLALPAGGSYSATVLADSPLWYYRLGEPASALFALDSCAGGHAGVVVGSVTQGEPTLLQRDADLCAKTSGSAGDNYISAGDLDVAGSAITVEAWIKPTSNSQTAKIVAKHQDSTDVQGTLGISTGGASFEATCGGTYHGIVGGTALVANAIHHIVGVYDGAHIRIYVDGVEDAAAVAASGSLANNNWPWAIGALKPSGAGNNNFAGWIDEAAVYAATLSSARIAAHYAAGS
jgi:hypothetical protein